MSDSTGSAGAAEDATGDAARLQALLDIAKVVGAARRFEDLIELTAEEARRALDAASLSISRLERETGLLRTLVNVGSLGPGEPRFPADEVYPLAEWPRAVSRLEARQGHVTVVGQDGAEAELLARLGKGSSAEIPIVVEARVWGAMFATRGVDQQPFTDADLDFVQAVATQVAAGIVQADHFARVERLAFEDPLTGLANRRAVDERLEASMEDFLAHGTPVSLILADINRLKQVNDTFGHGAGDRMIVAVADAVSRASGLAPGSLAARIGGDEFCIVVSGVPAEVAVRVGEELCRLVDGQPRSTGVSCGIASTDAITGPVNTPVRLFRLADAAQYRAKRAGTRRPVVAGAAVPDDPGEPPVDRRARRGRLAVDAAAALEAGIEKLDRSTGEGTQVRAGVVAEHLTQLLDGAAWWVSYVAPGSRSLTAVTSSVQRSGERGDQDALAATFDLDEFPATDAALREAQAFRVELGAPGGDPAEEAALVTAGYSGVLVAGATGPDGGWLVEVYTDSISLPLAGVEPIARSLLALAVTGARPRPGLDRDRPAGLDPATETEVLEG